MTTSADNSTTSSGDRNTEEGPRVPRFLLLSIVLVVALLPLVFRNREAEAPRLISLDGPTMGTTYSVKLSSPPSPGPTSEDLHEKIRATLDRINKRMSTYDPESEVSRFNRHQSRDWFEMSGETIAIILAAREISEVTEGAFDITIGPLVDLWGFGGKSKVDPGTPPQIPPKSQIQIVRGRIGFQHLELRESPPAVRRKRVGLEIDLSAIAKGYGVDQIAEILAEARVERFMVEVGGEVRTQGLKPDETPWLIGIEAPIRGRRQVDRPIELRNTALATSGDYRNYFHAEGTVYSHVLDPRTGYPVQHRVASTTVIADKCTDADALATGLMVLGPEEGYRVALEHNVAVLWMLRQNGNHTAPAGETGQGAGPLVESNVESGQRSAFIHKSSPAFERREVTKGSPE